MVEEDHVNDRTGQVWRHIDSVMLVIGSPVPYSDTHNTSMFTYKLIDHPVVWLTQDRATRKDAGQTYFVEGINNTWDDSPHLTRLL